jgi:hypothetical protein
VDHKQRVNEKRMLKSTVRYQAELRDVREIHNVIFGLHLIKHCFLIFDVFVKNYFSLNELMRTKAIAINVESHVF